MFAPGFVFMAFQLSTNFSAGPKRKIGTMSLAHMHWVIAAVLSFVGVIALILLLNHPLSREMLKNADKKLAEEAAKKDFEKNQLSQLSGGASSMASKEKEGAAAVDASMGGVAKMIGISLVSIFASIFAIVVSLHHTDLYICGLYSSVSVQVQVLQYI